MTEQENKIQPIEINRVYDISREILFDYMTKEEHLKQWFCPTDFTIEEFSNDLEINGQWTCKMRDPNKNLWTLTGEYLEIDKPSKLVYTHQWLHDDGNVTARTEVTVKLESEGDRTKLNFKQRGFTHKGGRDGHEEGWIDTFKNLEKYLTD